MDSLSSDIEAKKIKLKLKQWELNFLEENKRKPNKDDIDNSAEDVKTMYKDYYKMSQERRTVSNSATLEAKEVKVASDVKPNPWGSDLNKSSCDNKMTVKKPLSAVQRFGSKLRAHAHLLQVKKSYASSPRISPVEDKVEANDDILFKPHFKVKLTNETMENETKGKALTPSSAREVSFSRSNSQVFFNNNQITPCKNPTVDMCNYVNSRTVKQLSDRCLESPKNSVLNNEQALPLLNANLETSRNTLLKDKLAMVKPKCGASNENMMPANVPNVDNCSKDAFKFEEELEAEKPEMNLSVSKRMPKPASKAKKAAAKTGQRRRQFVESDSESASEMNVKTKKRKAQTRSSPAQRKKLKSKDKLENVECKSSKERKQIQHEPANNQSTKYLDKEEMEALACPPKKAKGRKQMWRNTKKTPSTENYVRINLKKKVFCRGKKQFNYRRYKFGKWKQLQLGKEQFKEEPCIDGFNSESDDDLLAAAADAVSVPAEIATENSQSIDERVAEDMDANLCEYSVTDPMFELVDGQLPKSALTKVRKVLNQFGYASFRDGQLEAMTRVLAGLSTLVIQPTGTGKSLCYLLPAYMYAQRSKCTALVVSPLVSLMEDQLLRVPSCLKAACMHTNMTATQRKKVKEAISQGNVHVLFVSPESLVGSAGSPYGILPQDMPPISFVCIDEVHCVSTWSHNFRPTYLRLCRVIRETLRVQCVLGLTATATMKTIENIVTHLELKDEVQSVIRGTVLPPNLQLTVSRDHREEAFLNLLRREPYSECESIIIYCIRREQTERLASLIRTSLQHCKDEWTAEAYHAGLVPSKRRSVQNHFMSGKLRVVVATVAFGMGLNKADVRAVIHYNMPKSIESYVQEIGRAGRDGEPAYCHVFLDLNGEDRQELRRHIYANTVDRAALGKLLKLVFVRCKCKKLQQMERMLSNENDPIELADQAWRCKGHEVAFSVEATVEQLDIKEEAIETILCTLEMQPKQYVQILNRMYGTCSIFCYGGTEQLNNLVAQCRPVAVAAALDKKVERRKQESSRGRQSKENTLEFPLVKIASLMGCKASILRKQLSKLQWNELKGSNGESKYCKSGVVVDFNDLSFHVRAAGDLDDDEKDVILNDLHACIAKQEQMEVEQLEKFYAILNKVSFPHQSACEGEIVKEKSQILKDVIHTYFENSTCPELDEFSSCAYGPPKDEDVSRVGAHIRQFLSIHYGENNFSGRAVARIFHGIGSPRYPAEIWGRVRQFWRSQLNFDFNVLCKMATEEILRFR